MLTRIFGRYSKLRFCDFQRRIMTQNGTTKYELRFSRVHEDAKQPIYSSANAAGMDLSSCEDAVVPAKGKMLVNIGLKLAIPHGYYGRVAPRSGLAVKNFIDVGAGVIDEDYRGELKVLLFNFGENDFHVKKGERVAQLLVEKVLHCELLEIPESELDVTVRGAAGFGSTGV
ncbi:Deoxyuridine 5'-triphosphate nucleotidohydrolase [Aphelenchoides besseyi]|nr:Deoxyuridine 5'-triphosphate nucleotidohydrolase [Aphelenchoides besseyi]